MDNTSTEDAIEDNGQKCQASDKASQPIRVRSGMGTVNYWKARLFRNSYRDRKTGQTVQIPEYYVRMRHAGITRRVRLHSSEKETAADGALRLFQRLEEHGWSEIVARQSRMPASPTVDEFLAAYVTATASMERAPRPITVRLYTRSLRQLCALVGVERIRELTPQMIEKARDTYRQEGRKAQRAETGIRNTISTLVRNSAACFSREARAIMKRNGLDLENPFTGIKCKSDIQPVSPLPHNIVDTIWKDAPLLRDGDPTAKSPDLKKYRARYRKAHEGREPGRWVPIDFSKPHPDAYAALLLAFGCGLRANEVDKARWSWLKFDSQGNCYIEVAEEDDFRPKGETRRMIKISSEVHDMLASTRRDLGSPYIIGGPASTKASTQGGGFYRCPDTIRTLNTWLRERGVEAENKFGKPMHRLRKQFGSEVATKFGLFNAQKLLGHKSPAITAAHYAAQTELPTLTHVRLVG